MVRLGKRPLGKDPTLVLALSRDEPVLRQARKLGIDAIELRVDGLAEPDPANAMRVVQALRRHGLPIIGTVRGVKEGGWARISDAQRARLYESILPSIDAIDVEIASAAALAATLAAARRQRKKTILSFHDFQRTPSTQQLESLLSKGKAAGADIVKIAATPRSRGDVIRLFELLLLHRHEDLVVIAMGELGSISRLLFPLAGSLLTYTNVKPGVGQVPLRPFAEHLKLYYPNRR